MTAPRPQVQSKLVCCRHDDTKGTMMYLLNAREGFEAWIIQIVQFRDRINVNLPDVCRKREVNGKSSPIS